MILEMIKPYIEIIPMILITTFVYTTICFFIDDYFQRKEEKRLDG